MSHAPQLFEFPFSGREKEVELLQSLLDSALAGEGGVGVITGEPGVGKTRLSRAVLDLGKAAGFTCLISKSPKGGSLLPYSVWVDCLRQLTAKMSVQSFFESCGNSAPQILRLLPELDATRVGRGAGSAEDEEQIPSELLTASPLRIFDAVSHFFYNLSNSSPLLILLDDLQWCDKTSLSLLSHFIESGLRNHKVVVLCACRDTHLDSENPSLHKLISGFSITTGKDRVIRLERFDLANSSKLIHSAPVLGQATDSLCNVLYKKTGGNPFFLRELLIMLEEERGIGANSPSPLTATNFRGLEVPDTVEEVVKQRLAPLDKELIEALKLAALIGEDFDFGVLREASKVHDESRLFELILEAEKAGIVRRKAPNNGQGVYSFGDEIMMDVLTEGVSPGKAVAYHLAIGSILERDFSSGSNERSAELALHFKKAGDWGKCLEYSRLAGDFAAARNAHVEASDNYATALESLDKLGSDGPAALRGHILERLGDELGLLGNELGAFQAWDEATKAFESSRENERAAILHRKMGWIQTIGVFTKESASSASKHLDASLKILEAGPRGPQLAYLYHALALWHWYFGEVEKARMFSKESLDIATEKGISNLEALCSGILAITSPVSDVGAALEFLKKAEMYQGDSKTRLDVTSDTSLVHWRLGLGYRFATDDSHSALPNFLDSVETAIKAGIEWAVIYLRLFAATHGYLPLGDWAKVEEEMLDMLSWPYIKAFPAMEAIDYSTLGTISLLKGDLAKSEDLLLKGYAAWRELPSGAKTIFVPLIHGSLGRLYMEKGDFSGADRYLHEGYSALMTRGLIVESARSIAEILALRVELYERQGQRHEALECLEELRLLMETARQDWALAIYSEAAGYMASEKEEWERAQDDYEEAARRWKTLSRPYEQARASFHSALAYQNTGKTEKANGQFEIALGMFTKLGAKPDAEKVRSERAAGEDASSFSVVRLRGSAKEGSRAIFDYLETAFVADYYSKRLSPESSGWRTFGDIARETKLPVSAFYKGETRDAGGLGELERMGLVEVRLYSGERGRGGTVTRARIAYGKDEVKKHVSRRVTKASRK